MKHKRESGEVVVEASIVVTLVLIIITAMLYLGIMMYQQTLVSVMANQTAANIAQVYSNNMKDPFTGYVDAERVYQTVTYSNMKSDAYLEVIEQKAGVFARYRLKSSRLLVGDETTVSVEIVKKPNELLKSQVVVTIRDSYDVPLVSFFGVDSGLEFAASGRADCVDILEYINGVEAVGNPEESNISSLPDVKLCTVTFVPERGNLADSEMASVLRGKSVLSSAKYTRCVMPAEPVREGKVFAGWYDEKGNPFTASTEVNGDLVVYAAWECTVTLDADGGLVKSQAVYSFKTNAGERAFFPNATRANYIFQGWYTEKGGKGSRYLSNDSVITGDLKLYAYWTCAHPSRYEAYRTGSVCEGGTIYYKCTQCQADMGTGKYAGSKHSFTWKCDVKHSLRSAFNGTPSGGCGGYHQANKWCDTCKVTHGKVYGYCVICRYCYKTSGYLWCGNNHCYYNIYRRPCHAPSNGHIR